MQIGFTGTQGGMTASQHIACASLLDVLTQGGGHVHHGDCIGADADFHAMCVERKLRIEIHPPIKPAKRAFCEADILWPEYDYLVRNRHIVDCSDTLIATPGEATEKLRSGTWSTVRRAREKGIRIFIIHPNGNIKEESCRR